MEESKPLRTNSTFEEEEEQPVYLDTKPDKIEENISTPKSTVFFESNIHPVYSKLKLDKTGKSEPLKVIEDNSTLSDVTLDNANTTELDRLKQKESEKLTYCDREPEKCKIKLDKTDVKEPTLLGEANTDHKVKGVGSNSQITENGSNLLTATDVQEMTVQDNTKLDAPVELKLIISNLEDSENSKPIYVNCDITDESKSFVTNLDAVGEQKSQDFQAAEQADSKQPGVESDTANKCVLLDTKLNIPEEQNLELSKNSKLMESESDNADEYVQKSLYAQSDTTEEQKRLDSMSEVSEDFKLTGTNSSAAKEPTNDDSVGEPKPLDSLPEEEESTKPLEKKPDEGLETIPPPLDESKELDVPVYPVEIPQATYTVSDTILYPICIQYTQSMRGAEGENFTL